MRYRRRGIAASLSFMMIAGGVAALFPVALNDGSDMGVVLTMALLPPTALLFPLAGVAHGATWRLHNKVEAAGLELHEAWLNAAMFAALTGSTLVVYGSWFDSSLALGTGLALSLAAPAFLLCDHHQMRQGAVDAQLSLVPIAGGAMAGMTVRF